jgi:hypothetical protein
MIKLRERLDDMEHKVNIIYGLTLGVFLGMCALFYLLSPNHPKTDAPQRPLTSADTPTRP